MRTIPFHIWIHVHTQDGNERHFIADFQEFDFHHSYSTKTAITFGSPTILTDGSPPAVPAKISFKRKIAVSAACLNICSTVHSGPHVPTLVTSTVTTLVTSTGNCMRAPL